MAEKLKYVLAGVVVLLAAAVVYGYLSDGAEDQNDSTQAVTRQPAAAGTTTAPESQPGPEASEGGAASDGGAAPGREAKPQGGDGGAKPKGEGGAKSPGNGNADGGKESRPAREDTDAKPSGEPTAPAGEGESAETSPTKAVFIKRVDRICAKVPSGFARRAKEVQTKNSSATPAELAKLLSEAAAPALLEAAQAIDALQPPAGDESKAEAMVAALEAAARKMERSPGSSLDGDDSPVAGFAKLTDSYGMRRCSQF